MKNVLILIIILCIVSGIAPLAAQSDSVDVTFYYQPSNSPNNVWLPGEFNGWVISNSISLMNFDAPTGTWWKTERLRVGGPDPLPSPHSIPGAYQYKFNADGTWLSDPLNPRQNPSDYNNSYLFINDPTIHYLLPNDRPAVGVQRTRFPEISAYIFPAVGFAVDTSTLVIKIDSLEFSGIGSRYDVASKRLSFTPPVPLGDGTHSLILVAGSSSGSVSSDTTEFEVQADAIQILSLPATTWKSAWPLRAAIFNTSGGFDTTVVTAEILRHDSTWTVRVNNGQIDTVMSLLEGDNYFRVRAFTGGQLQTSDSLSFTRLVNHAPTAQINISQNGSQLFLSAVGSTDPDSQALTFLWREDPANPEALGVDGSSDVTININRPASPGEYYLELWASDPDQQVDSTRSFFVVDPDTPDVRVAGYEDNPGWVKNGRIYLLYFKSFTPAGTIRAAIPNLPYIKAMGFNAIWVLPVMEIPGDADNQINIGYNIIDFLNVEQSLGTNQDFRDFIDAAHALGLKVILDITPNHTGREHPFAREALLFGDRTQYWNYYQTRFIPHQDRAGGQFHTPEGIYYYGDFSDQLLNYEWADIDAREYMIDVYQYWVSEFDLDGFRFDVYWGPRLRYGRQNFEVPVREALKHIKPDILLLGEDDGTGIGTEVVYADQGGGLDLAYDFQLYHSAIKNFGFTNPAVNNLHLRLDNDGYYPGENAYFMRFMESQDEDRITYRYDSYIKTKPVASAIFLAPGLPMMYSGQEVGFGRGMGNPGEPDLNDRRRGVIDWNFPGRPILQEHYQKLAQIRGQFPAFSQHRKDTNGDGAVTNADESDFIRLSTGTGIVYAFLRPYEDANGLAVISFSSISETGVMNLLSAGLKFSNGFDPNTMYWVNNLYADTSYQVLGSNLANFSVNLEPYGTAVFTIATEEEHPVIPPLPQIVGIGEQPGSVARGFRLYPNFPNPFNPSTTVKFDLPVRARVTLEVYNILGQRVTELAKEFFDAGTHQVRWDGRNQQGQAVASGIYILHMRAGNVVQNQRMLLLK